jgi:uncharacterized membrane-anchored protein YhcB (DUF1043 family)
MKKVRLSNPFKSNWLLTLVSTMLGVVAGFYLTNYGSEKALANAQQKALQAVYEELADNRSTLTDYQQILSGKYQASAAVFSHINEGLELLVPKDSLQSFLKKSEAIFTLQQAKDTLPNTLKLKGNLNLDINSKLMVSNLSSIVWSSYKQTQYLSITPFECISQIETIHDLQERFNDRNNLWKNTFFEGQFMQSVESRQQFLNQWAKLLSELELIMKLLNSSDEILQSCN